MENSTNELTGTCNDIYIEREYHRVQSCGQLLLLVCKQGVLVGVQRLVTYIMVVE